MNAYEAMFIFPETVKEEARDEVVGRVRAEIEKAGGQISNTTRLGKRAFARFLHKQQAGHYVVIGFKMDGAHLAPMTEKFKLSEEIFRVQINRIDEKAVARAKEAAEKKAKRQENGVPQ